MQPSTKLYLCSVFALGENEGYTNPAVSLLTIPPLYVTTGQVPTMIVGSSFQHFYNI